MNFPQNSGKVWSWLSRCSPFTPAGIAGLMGNLYAESGLEPGRMQGDFHPLRVKSRDYTEQVENGTRSAAAFAADGVGYGLAQWTYPTRKSALLRFARANGAGIDDLHTQLNYMLQELSGDYSAVGDLLRTTDDPAAASSRVLAVYENPADQSPRVHEQRAGYAREFYRAFTDDEEADDSAESPAGQEPEPAPADPLAEYLNTQMPPLGTPLTRADIRRFIDWAIEEYGL